MLDREDKLRDHWIIKQNSILLFKVTIMSLLGFLLIFESEVLAAEETEDLGTIYHIYVDDRYIDAVNDKEVVQNIINEKVLTGLEIYKDIKIGLTEEIKIVPEKSFELTYDNEKVAAYLESHLTISAQAVALKVDDQIVSYFNDEETAEEVLKAYQLKYISEKDFERIESEEEQTLSVDDTLILGVEFLQDISIYEATTSPEDILDIEQGIQLLEKGTLEEKVHEVNEGEVLGEIASQYDLSTKKLITLNEDLTDETVLQIGQKINVTAYESFVDVITTEEKKVEEKIDFNVEIIESEDMYKGEEKVKQEGKTGEKEVHYNIKKQNGQIAKKEVVTEEVTKNPVDKVLIKGTKVIPSRGSGDLTWPADGGYISSHQGDRWGSFHKGIDIAGPSGRTILAADHGVVESAGFNNGGYGNKIVINHNNGMKTIYAHLDSIDVNVGQVVEKDTKIGVMGSTGNSTGVHLHFEVYEHGELKNPTKYY